MRGPRRTNLDEHFRVEGRGTGFETAEEMQASLDQYLGSYNTKWPHQDRGMNGRTPLKAFVDGIPDEPEHRAKTPNQVRSLTLTQGWHSPLPYLYKLGVPKSKQCIAKNLL